MTALAARRVMIETARIRDITGHLSDGSTETRRARPGGDGGTILLDPIWAYRWPEVSHATVRVTALQAAQRSEAIAL